MNSMAQVEEVPSGTKKVAPEGAFPVFRRGILFLGCFVLAVEWRWQAACKQKSGRPKTYRFQNTKFNGFGFEKRKDQLSAS